jgi:hypothetical protein
VNELRLIPSIVTCPEPADAVEYQKENVPAAVLCGGRTSADTVPADAERMPLWTTDALTPQLDDVSDQGLSTPPSNPKLCGAVNGICAAISNISGPAHAEDAIRRIAAMMSDFIFSTPPRSNLPLLMT